MIRPKLRVHLKWVAAAPLFLLAGLIFADQSFPPPDPAAFAVSQTVLGRGGELPVQLSDVDPLLQRMIIAYEDKRFYNHIGIDPVASVRALKQLVTTGHIISGGSTLTMQLARLLEPRENRSVKAKLTQMARAMQMERRYSKEQILQWYFTFAPYGGNLEGVRAASLSWFGKEPRKLSVAEAALLVALPQSPEARRPDKFPARILAARNRVIARMVEAGVIPLEDTVLARLEPLPNLRINLPALAAHATNVARLHDTAQLTIDAQKQRDVERVMRDATKNLDPTLSMAVLVADVATGEVVARAGSAKPFDQQSKGWIDMTRAVRSPGSTLKPFIYALAFENGFALPETLIEDRAESFRGYQPKNFNQSFHGTVTLRQALQQSLNLPAVQLLDAVGPLRLAATLREAGVTLKLPRNTSPTLAVALGGVGLTLEDLVTLYSAFPRGGVPFILHDHSANQREASAAPELFGADASWYVSDILAGTAPPDGVLPLPISYKTGTSYGYRDAWALGFDRNYVVGVWVGRADGTAVAELTGRKSAAPVLFNVFATLKSKNAAQRPRIASPIPATLKHFGIVAAQFNSTSHPLQIMFPPEGAKLSRIMDDHGDARPVVVKVEGGAAPYRVLINGAPVAGQFRTKNIDVAMQVAGYANLTLIDANGLVDHVNMFLQ
jgi:penicillin-binding protein 1C